MYFVVETDRNRGVGAQGVAKRLEGIEHRAEDLAPAFAAIYASFLKTEQGIFNSQGGGKWQPLTARYLARKTARGEDPRIERATGELYQALARGQGPGAVHTVTEDEMVVGTNLQRAVYAQRGSGRRRRRLVTMDRARRKRWTATMQAYLTDGAPGGDE